MRRVDVRESGVSTVSMDIDFASQLKRGYKGGDREMQESVDSVDMAELVGVREMLAIPGQKEVAAIVGGQCQVERISQGVSGHHTMFNVDLDNFNDCRLNLETGQCINERKRLCFRGIRTPRELLDHRAAGYEIVRLASLGPPVPGPETPSRHVW